MTTVINPPIDPDPYSLVSGSMWNMVLNSPVLMQMIQPGNLIRFDDDNRNPLKERVLTADLPELILMPDSLGAAETNLFATNTSSEIVQTFKWFLNSGDFRTNKVIMPISWALLCAMAKWKDVATKLKWHGNQFVKLVEVNGGQIAHMDPNRNGGIQGWTLTCQVGVQMWINTQDMLNWG